MPVALMCRPFPLTLSLSRKGRGDARHRFSLSSPWESEGAARPVGEQPWGVVVRP
jgi:hypothetical protein